MGDAVIKVIHALHSLGGEASTGDIALSMGRVGKNGKGNSGAISALIKRLKDWKVIEKVSHGRYKLAPDYEQKLFMACESRGEFIKDEQYKIYKQARRERYESWKKQFRVAEIEVAELT